MLLPPPSLNRIGFLRPRKMSATTPHPPLNRVDMALHTKAGPLLRKILDLRLSSMHVYYNCLRTVTLRTEMVRLGHKLSRNARWQKSGMRA